MEARTALASAGLAAAECDIDSTLTDALDRHDEDTRLTREWGAIGCQAYARHKDRVGLFTWTEHGVDAVRRKLKTAGVQVTEENLTTRALQAMEVAVRKVAAYDGTNPSWAEAARLPDVIDLLLAYGRKKTRELVLCLRRHARDLSDFCHKQGIVPVVNSEHPYARLTNCKYVLSLLIDAAARMVRDGHKKALLVIAAKADPVPLLQRVLGPHSRPFLEGALRAQCGNYGRGLYIHSGFRKRRKDRYWRRPVTRGHRQLMATAR